MTAEEHRFVRDLSGSVELHYSTKLHAEAAEHDVESGEYVELVWRSECNTLPMIHPDLVGLTTKTSGSTNHTP